MSDEDGYKQKLIDTKEQWAAEGRGLTGAAPQAGDKPRLPPGQRLTQDFPVLDLGIQPPIDPKDFRLTTSGLIESPIDWGWDDFQAQPQVEMTTDIHCVTTWSRYDNVRSEEHTSELQSHHDLVCRLLLEKKKKKQKEKIYRSEEHKYELQMHPRRKYTVY